MQFYLRQFPDPAVPPIGEPPAGPNNPDVPVQDPDPIQNPDVPVQDPDPIQNPDVPVREPDPAEPNQI